MSDAYKLMLRHLVRDQGDPRNFNASAVRLSDEQLAIALAHFDDALPEVAGDIAESVCDVLRFKRNNGFVQMLGSQSHYEAIGLALVAGCRNRLLPRVKADAVLAAHEIELEDAIDDEFTREVV